LLWASGVISSIIVAAVLLRNDIGALARTSHVARNGIWFGATGVVLALIWTAFALTVGSSPLLWLLYAGISMTLVSLTISWISVVVGGDEAVNKAAACHQALPVFGNSAVQLSLIFRANSRPRAHSALHTYMRTTFSPWFWSVR